MGFDPIAPGKVGTGMAQTRRKIDEAPADPDAPLAALVDSREDFLRFLMRRTGSRSEAEDVLQDFCLRVLARKDQLRDADRMTAWLYAILRSTLNDHFRKTGRQSRLGEAVASEPQVSEAPDAVEAMTAICGCVGGLVPGLRASDAQLIRRIEFAEEDRATVAADLDLSPGALAVRLHRARAALRDRLLDHCGSCCAEGFEDCSCAPDGCHSESHDSHCGPAPERG